MQKSAWVFLCIGCFISGIVAAGAYYELASSPKGERWIKLSAPVNSSDQQVSHATDASPEAELPPVTSLTGKAKFVKGSTGSDKDIKLGYIIDAEIAAVDKAEIPAKYRAPQPASASPAAGDGILGTMQYEVVFYFIMKDKDGFPLLKAASNKQKVRSGDTNHFQLFANSLIPAATAANTHAIDMRMEVVRCLTCESGKAEAPRAPAEKRSSTFSLF